jgi:hypothetical protein
MPRDQATFSTSVRLSLRKKYQDRCVVCLHDLPEYTALVLASVSLMLLQGVSQVNIPEICGIITLRMFVLFQVSTAVEDGVMSAKYSRQMA